LSYSPYLASFTDIFCGLGKKERRKKRKRINSLHHRIPTFCPACDYPSVQVYIIKFIYEGDLPYSSTPNFDWKDKDNLKGQYVSSLLFFVVTGEHSLSGSEGHEQHMTIEKIISHPKYVHETYDYDLALIKLQSPLTYNNRVGPVCFPKFDIAVDTECYVKGWGHTEYGGNVSQVSLETSGRRLWLTNICA